MPALTIIGAQWGDEGKGKLVDCLSAHASLVVRFYGGDNAGHTLVVGGQKTKLRLIPSGVLHPGVRCLLAAGVVLNPEVFQREMNELTERGIKLGPDRLLVDREAHLVLRYHVALDQAREAARGANKLGTTGRGIGPAYEDRSARCGVRVAELLRPDELKRSLRDNIAHKCEYLSKVYGVSPNLSLETEWDWLMRATEPILPLIVNGSLLTDRALAAGEKVVFEGAQGTFLDQTFGTVPYVTSSHTLAGGVCVGVGIGPHRIDKVLGIAKAYCTRVGSGPFPTELNDSTGELIRERGGEFGTVTGRPRRCGWCDAVALRRAVRLNGFNSLAVTKLDVLSGLETIKLCIGYKLDGKEIDDVPALASEVERVQPIYLEYPGWKEDITSARSVGQLPKAARDFIDGLENASQCIINVVGVGPEREQLLWRGDSSWLESFCK